MNTRSSDTRRLRSSTKAATRKTSSLSQPRSATRRTTTAIRASRRGGRSTQPQPSTVSQPATRARPSVAEPQRSRVLRSASSQASPGEDQGIVPPIQSSSRARRTVRSAPEAAEAVLASRPSESTTSPTSLPSRRRKTAEESEIEAAGPSKRRRTETQSSNTDAAAAVALQKAAEVTIRKLTQEKKRLETEAKRGAKKLKQREDVLEKLRADVDSLAAELETEQALSESLSEENRKLESLLKDGAKERAVMQPAVQATKPDVMWVLSQLEDQFQCSLCFEVMAFPHEINHARCGHAFCGLCALKWCFAAVHRDCGYWHEALECPLCRSELAFIPDVTPRAFCTFPFIPNRLADTTIKSYLEILQDAAKAHAGGSRVGGMCGGGGSGIDERILAWGEGGSARVEWEARDRRGRSEMSLLSSNWMHYAAVDFIAFKDRLEQT